MGKGDRKTKKGKIFSGSYGNTRPRKSSSQVTIQRQEKITVEKKNNVKKTTTKKKKASKK